MILHTRIVALSRTAFAMTQVTNTFAKSSCAWDQGAPTQ
jgi:hypothetical protein